MIMKNWSKKPYHPSTNGLFEWSNQIRSCLVIFNHTNMPRMCISPFHSRWILANSDDADEIPNRVAFSSGFTQFPKIKDITTS